MKVTIITPSFNRAKTLAHTIKSVREQSYKDIEYIIIDGASTDETPIIIKKYEPLFKGRLKWISESDKGVYDALNKGIQMATGDVIGILHSDDYFTNKDIVEQIVGTFQNNNCDAVYGDVHYVSPENLNKCIRYYSSKIFKPSLMRLGFIPAHPTFYMKKVYYDKFERYKTNYKIAADFEFLLRVLYKGNVKTVYLPMDMVTMRTRGLSTSGWKSYSLIMKEHLRACKENNVYTNFFILSLRYYYKVFELVYYNLKNLILSKR